MISVFERMDAAMLKYGIYAKAVELLCFQPALEKLSAVYPEMDIKSYKKNVKHEYKNMLLRTPDIGGSSLEMNLYIAAFVFSLHKAEPDKITPAVVDAMVTAVFNSPFMIKAHKNKKCTLFTDKVQDKKVKESIASQTSEYALDWKFRYEKGVDEFYNTYTECGICKLGIEGKGPYDIARILFDDKIDTPAVYFGKQNKGVWKSKEEFSNPYNWSGYVVGQILSKPEYMGHTVNFRSHKQSYKDKNAVMNPKEDWLIFEDTHEAIVDRETWELAQKLRKTPKRIDTLGEANPLTGLLYCADCGEKMYNHRSKGGTENNPYPSDFFDCSSYTLARQKRTAACCGHYITTKALRTLILDTIRTVSTFAISNQAAFMEKVRSASQLRQTEAAKDAKRKLSKDKKRIAELDTIIKKLYESFAVGRITDERFDSLLADYEAEQKTLQASVTEAEERLSAFAEDSARVEQFLELARKYTDFSELTTPMINEFIEKIIVHAPERIDGDRVQEVEIHLRFIGQFELPAPELTEEEIKRQEFLKKERIRSRERYQKLKSGERTVGVPVTLTCKCCGQEFASKRTNTLFCGPNCRAKFYRQEAAEGRSRACTCENCGKEFITTRSDVKYCSDDCRYAAQINRQGARKKALREAKNEKETKTT